ncbi:MAG TPA: aromatic amino acid DMT transporter YddG [Candidatus Hydrogenedentes bacterium]|nr:aromatic amino acid DMT transporter YddG [Candidatus Hydrogenedentota bacterium]
MFTRSWAGTAAGILAILFWGTNIAFSRSVMEQLGTFTAGALSMLIAGVASMVYLASQRGAFRKTIQLPKRYLFICGGIFVAEMMVIVAAIGFASDHQQLIEVTIINYLWPSLTLAFAMPILGRRGSMPLLALGVILAFGGIVLALSGGTVSFRSFWTHPAPHLLALAAAILWALYSNLSHLWTNETEGWATPFFFLAAAAGLFVLLPFAPTSPQWSIRSVVELFYLGLAPTMLGYILWDVALRRGRIILVVTLSYFIPILSTLISSLYLSIPIGEAAWLGCIMVVAGALLCHRSLP